MVKYIGRLQGSRSMKGVRGDLFASSTWLEHSLATLENRGLIVGRANEAAVMAITDMEFCIKARVAEHGSVAKKGIYKRMELSKSTPATYDAIVKRRIKEQAAEGENQGSSSTQRPKLQLGKRLFDMRSFSAPSKDIDEGLGEENCEKENDSVEDVEDMDDAVAAQGMVLGAGPVQE